MATAADHLNAFVRDCLARGVAGVVSLWYVGDLRREQSLAGHAGRPLPPPDAPNGHATSRDGFFTHGPGQRTFTVTVPEKPHP